MSKRRGHDCCCNFCAKRGWCSKNPSKGRQCCTEKQKSAECLTLIGQRWCSTCPLFIGRSERFGADEPALPGLGPERVETMPDLAAAIRKLKEIAPDAVAAPPPPPPPHPPRNGQVFCGAVSGHEEQAPGDEEIDG